MSTGVVWVNLDGFVKKLMRFTGIFSGGHAASVVFQSLQDNIIGRQILRSVIGEILKCICFYPANDCGYNRFDQRVLNVEDLIHGGVEVVRPYCVFSIG